MLRKRRGGGGRDERLDRVLIQGPSELDDLLGARQNIIAANPSADGGLGNPSRLRDRRLGHSGSNA